MVLADFGYATFENINHLKSYRGTKTYMAPEIKEGRIYDGRQADIFSVGVILFVIVLGIFPFNEAKRAEPNYRLIMEGEIEEYWANMDEMNYLSKEFKELIMSMVSYDASERPTVSELSNHAWMNPQ